jgi:uncharacterized protein YbjT (DUF2867 family)
LFASSGVDKKKLIHISAIGADANHLVPYARTKGLGEQAVIEKTAKSKSLSTLILRPRCIYFVT